MKKSYCEKERTKLETLNKFQLANTYKKVGISIVVITFLLLIAKKFVEVPDWLKPVLSNLLLLGLLIISISKDKVEDEYIDSLRSQSYRLAFVIAIVYSLIQPVTNYIVDFILNKDSAAYHFDYFQILFFMLLIQLMFFRQLKKMNR